MQLPLLPPASFSSVRNGALRGTLEVYMQQNATKFQGMGDLKTGHTALRLVRTMPQPSHKQVSIPSSTQAPTQGSKIFCKPSLVAQQIGPCG